MLLRVGCLFFWRTSRSPQAVAYAYPGNLFRVLAGSCLRCAFGSNSVDLVCVDGSATIFDRLFHRQVRFAGDPGDSAGFDPMAPGRELNFARLIAQGRQIFVKEKFEGNGRACGTCHVENHNFTVDPDFIATLPRTDPLFVAEHNPSLAAGFEKPDLMRRFGLFIVNADGFDDLQAKFTMRSAQPVLALRNSSVRPDPSFGIDFTSNGHERGSTRTAGLEQ